MSGLIVPASTLGLQVYLQKRNCVSGGGNLSAATQRIAVNFVADRSASMTGFKQQFGSITSAPVIQADLYLADTTTHIKTGSSLATVTFTPTANLLNDLTFSAAFTTTAGVEYVLEEQITGGTSAALHVGINGSYLNNVVHASNDTGTTYFNSLNNSSGLQSLAWWPKFTGPVTVGMVMGTGQSSGAGSTIFYQDASHIIRLGLKYIFPVQSGIVGYKLRELHVGGGVKGGSPTGYNLIGEICLAGSQASVSSTKVDVVQFSANSCVFFWDDGKTDNTMLADGSTAYFICIRSENASGTQSAAVGPRVLTCTNSVPNSIVGALQGGFESSAVTPSFSASTNIPMMDLVLDPVLGGGGAPSLSLG